MDINSRFLPAGHLVEYQVKMPLKSRDEELNMDADKNNQISDVICFDILSNDFELSEDIEISDGDLNIPADISELLVTVHQEDRKNNSEKVHFKNQNEKLRFSAVNESDLDELEGENNAQSTHWQTNWAVGVMRGNI